MTRPLHIPLAPGLPDAGAPGQWLGRDAHGAIYTLRWMADQQCFGALGWRATHPNPWPELVLLKGERADFILGHVEGPAIDTTAAQREGFLMAALADLARDDRTITAAPAPAWTPWLWTVAMLFGLPAAALALVFLAANTPGSGKPPPSSEPSAPVIRRSAP